MENGIAFYNSQDEYYKAPFGAVNCLDVVSFKLKVNRAIGTKDVFLRLWYDEGREEKIKMSICMENSTSCTYEVEFSAPKVPGLIWYYFIIEVETGKLYYGNNSRRAGGVGESYDYEPPSYQLTIYQNHNDLPLWFIGSIMYQIYTDRFFNGIEDGSILNPRDEVIIRENWGDNPEYLRDNKNRVIKYDFFGGNLEGVIKKLDYLKELNISVIYLNPIFESHSNHKYDTANYKEIDQMYGDKKTFKKLCKKADRLGIKIILDGVFSHTGSNSIYFNKERTYKECGAYNSKTSPYYSWYRFEEYPDKYESWWGVENLPNVNELDKSYMNFIIYDKDSVIKYWLEMGAKGWRLDVADELPDSFIEAIREEMKKVDKESLLIGEVWEDASNKVSYGYRRKYLQGKELDSIMNYPFRENMLGFLLGNQSSKDTIECFMKQYENYPPLNFYLNMNLIGTHDTRRILTELGEALDDEKMTLVERENYALEQVKLELGIKRLKLLSLVQMTFPGVPSIYYGDEVGLEGFKDPLNRRTYPWGRENHELLSWYKVITGIRNKYSVFKTGRWDYINTPDDIFGFSRYIKIRDILNKEVESNRAVILINRNKIENIKSNIYLGGEKLYRMYDFFTKEEYEIKEGRVEIKLLPLSYLVLIEKL